MGLKLLFILGVGVFLMGTGLRVWKKQEVSFVAGYGEFYHPTNEPLLAKRIGIIVMALGVETWISITSSAIMYQTLKPIYMELLPFCML